jgi:hypothetical protein
MDNNQEPGSNKHLGSATRFSLFLLSKKLRGKKEPYLVALAPEYGLSVVFVTRQIHAPFIKLRGIVSWRQVDPKTQKGDEERATLFFHLIFFF